MNDAKERPFAFRGRCCAGLATGLLALALPGGAVAQAVGLNRLSTEQRTAIEVASRRVRPGSGARSLPLLLTATDAAGSSVRGVIHCIAVQDFRSANCRGRAHE